MHAAGILKNSLPITLDSNDQRCTMQNAKSTYVDALRGGNCYLVNVVGMVGQG